jgi:BirA family biotin operon repressor/biotin-[acetyl-CoA-carboxylase] ligase
VLTEPGIKLLHQLADGKFHSGQALADLLACSRSSVWNHVQSLGALPGVTLDAVTGRGYRLRPALTLLDEQQICAGLDPVQRDSLQNCSIRLITDSTNRQALANAPQDIGKAHAWFAEYQTAGRGRRGRTWQGGFAQNLACSLAYKFDLPMNALAGLSIAVGAGLANCLAGYGVNDLGLKWPNDLLWQNKKMAGILLEVQGESTGPSTAVIGLGLNLQLDKQSAELIDQPYASLQQTGVEYNRNRLAGDILQTLLKVCDTYAQQGLQPFIDMWRAFDLYQGRQVLIRSAQQQWQGLYTGVAQDGGLLLEIDKQIKRFYAGEVSLRGT